MFAATKAFFKQVEKMPHPSMFCDSHVKNVLNGYTYVAQYRSLSRVCVYVLPYVVQSDGLLCLANVALSPPSHSILK